MAFIATDAEEVAPETEAAPTGGFVAPEDDHEAALQALVDDPEYDPISHAIESAKGGGDVNTYLEAYNQAQEVAFRRKQKPWTMADAAKIPGALVGGGIHFVKSLAGGLGSVAANTLTAATDESEANRERAKTEMAAGAQLAEHNARGFMGKLFGDQHLFGRIVGGITKPKQTGEEFYAEEVEREQNPKKFFQSYFNQQVEDERRRRQLASGQVDEKGTLASGLKSVADVAGDPTMMMSETFVSPEELEAQGAPVDPQAIEDISTPADPTNLLPLHVPGMGAVSRQVGGRALNLAGKVLEVPGRKIAGKIAEKVGNNPVAAATLAVASPATAAKAAGTYVAAKGSQKLGEALSNAGRELYDPKFVAPEAKDAVEGAMKGWDSKLSAMIDPKANAAALKRKGRQVTQGAVTAPIAFAPLAALASDDPEEFASLVGTASFIGALSAPGGLMGDRKQVVQQYQKDLISRGDSFRYGDEVLDSAHERAMQQVDPTTRDTVNAYRGFMEGLTGENGEPVQIYLLDGEGYNGALVKEGNPVNDAGVAESANTRGFASKDGSRVYINGTRSGSGETLGHETGHVADILARVTAPKLAGEMRGALERKLYKDGKPTPQFKKFIDTYTARLAGPDATPERIEEVKQQVNFEGEFIAETSRRLLAGQPVAQFALPPSLRESILEGSKDFLKETWGLNLGPFKGEVVAEVNRKTRDLLFNLGRMRNEGMEERAPIAPEVTPEAAPVAEAAPEGGFVAPAEAVAVEPARAGITQAHLDAARDAHMEFPDVPQTVRANAKRGTKGKSADKVADERAQEFDEIAEGYLSALEEAGAEANPDTFYRDVIVWHLQQGAPQVSPRPEATPNERIPNEQKTPATPPEPSEGNTLVMAPPSEVAPAPKESAAISTPEDVGKILEGAEAAALASPEYSRSRKNKDEIVRKAKIDALLEALPEGEGLRRRVDEFGESKIDGPIDFENPIHAELAKLAGVTEHGAEVISLLQESKGQHVFLDYASAEKPGADTGIDLDFTGEQRGKELAASPAAERVAGTAKATVQEGKSFVPLKTTMGKNGKINILGFSLDKVLNNTRHILDAMEAQKIPSGYDLLTGPELDKQVQADFIAMSENHANGYKGDGSGKMEQFPDTSGPKVDLDYVPQEIPSDRFDVLNMSMHNEAALARDAKKAKTKAAAQEAVSLADLNEGFLDPASGEVNELRQQLKLGGFDTGKVLESPFEMLKPELVKAVRTSTGDKKIVRPSGLDVDAPEMTKKLPQGKFTAAGFMPDTATADSIKSNPDDIRPAIRINGEIHKGEKGETHKQILDRYLDANPDDADALFDFDSKENPNFFVTPDGKELSRADLKEQFGVAHSQQLREKQNLTFMPDRDELGFYSVVEETVKAKIPNKASGKQILATLKSAPGVKSEEMDWIGLPEFLEGKESVTKEELQEFIESNKVKLEEEVKSTDNRPDPIEVAPEQFRWTERIAGNDRRGNDFEDETVLYFGRHPEVDSEFVITPVKEDERRYLSNSDAEYMVRGDWGDPFEAESIEDAKDIALNFVREDLESRRREDERDRDESVGNTKFSEWQIPGGENYKERLLTLPYSFEKSQRKVDEIAKRLNELTENSMELFQRAQTDPEARKEYDQKTEEFRKLSEEQQRLASAARNGGTGEVFKGSHWDEPNVVAHIREADHEDTDGNKVRLIEEIQSDWHQTGRKEGYKGDTSQAEKRQAEVIKELDGIAERAFPGKKVDRMDIAGILERNSEMGIETGIPADEMKAATKRARELTTEAKEEIAPALQTNAVPNAPFKKTWHELAFKKALRKAVEDGMDKIAWVPGDIHAERYDLSKHIREIEATPGSQGERYRIKATGHNGSLVINDTYDAAKLPDVVGKELAQKIIDRSKSVDPDEEARIYKEYNDLRTAYMEFKPDNPESFGTASFSAESNKAYNAFKEAQDRWNKFKEESYGPIKYTGLDLKVGGEGMTGFYDKIIPDFVRKYVKKWGGKVDKTELPDPSSEGFVERYGDKYRVRSGGTIKGVFDTLAEAEAMAYPDKTTTVHSVTITPEMRKSVNDGQPLFMPDEEIKNLAAVHNLSIGNLRHVLELGGIAVPSLAAVRTDRSEFTGFGDITLVAGKTLADPKTSKTKWFNADVYSPRYPKTQILFKDHKKARSVFDEYFQELADVKSNKDSTWNRYAWEPSRIIDAIEDRGWDQTQYTEAAQYAYLRANGLLDKPTADTKIEDLREILWKEVKPHQESIPAWVRDKLTEAGVKFDDKIFKGYNYSGNPTYTAHTLENVVKILKKEGIKDAEGFNYGVPSIRANMAKKFKSLEAMGKEREKIIPSKDMESLKEATSQEFLEMSDEINNLRKNPLEGFGMMDAISDDFKALAQGGSKNWTYLREQYGDNLPEFDKRVRPFLEKLRDMPTEYFEGKTQDAVYLQEFEGAAVPDDMPQDLLDRLKRSGLQIEKYKRSDNEARAKAVKKIAEERKANFMPSVTIGDTEVETGTPVMFDFLRGKRSATAVFGKPDSDSPFDRGYEPSGRYVQLDETGKNPDPEKYETGSIIFANPIVIEAGTYGEPSSWKRILSAKYGAKGKKLSRAILDDGFDGVITVYKDGKGVMRPSEILDLTTFSEAKAKYMPDADSIKSNAKVKRDLINVKPQDVDDEDPDIDLDPSL